MNFRLTTDSVLYICFVTIVLAGLIYSFEYFKLISQPHTDAPSTALVCPPVRVIYKDKIKFIYKTKEVEKSCKIEVPTVLQTKSFSEDARTFNYYGKSQR